MIKELHKRLTAISDATREVKSARKRTERKLKRELQRYRDEQDKLARSIAFNKKYKKYLKKGQSPFQAMFSATYNDNIAKLAVSETKSVLFERTKDNKFTGAYISYETLGTTKKER